MTNFIQEGDVLTLTAPYAVTSGQGAKIGSFFGIATKDIANGASGEFMIEGVFDITKATGLDFAQGDLVYWDNSQKKVVDTDSANSYIIGIAVTAAGTSATTARVKLFNQPVA